MMGALVAEMLVRLFLLFLSWGPGIHLNLQNIR